MWDCQGQLPGDGTKQRRGFPAVPPHQAQTKELTQVALTGLFTEESRPFSRGPESPRKNMLSFPLR
jgi:hypothetical protein